MRRIVVQQENGDNNYSNDITRSIDSQRIVAPQYGIGGIIRPDPSNPSRDSKRKAPVGTIAGQPFKYDTRRQRTSALKVDREILEHLLLDIDSGKHNERIHIVNLMRQRLKRMNSELAQRNLRSLASGKMQDRGSFYSLGARARARAA